MGVKSWRRRGRNKLERARFLPFRRYKFINYKFVVPRPGLAPLSPTSGSRNPPRVAATGETVGKFPTVTLPRSYSRGEQEEEEEEEEGPGMR